MHKKKLDLLLLTAHGIPSEDRYASATKYNCQGLFSRYALLTREEKDRIEKEYNVRDLFMEIKSDFASTYGIRDVGDSNRNGTRYAYVPPHPPALGVCSLATVAAAAGYSVQIIDNVIRWEWRQKQLAQIIMEQKPKVIGISTTFIDSPQVVKTVVDRLRAVASDSKIILGGATVRHFPELHSYADCTVFGNGEQAIIEIMEVMEGKRSPQSVAGIAYNDMDGNLCYSKSTAEIANIGRPEKPFRNNGVPIPITDWHLYNRDLNNCFPLEFSRGCVYNCYFCGYDRGKTVRSLEDLRNELIANAEKKITSYRVIDSDFASGPPGYPRFPHDVCQLMIDLDLGLEWTCYARGDNVDGELADLMRRAGCFGLFMGVESGDDGILKLIRKGCTSQKAYEGIRAAKENGMHVHTNFFVGYPGETRDTFENTLAFIEKTKPHNVTIGQFYLESHAPVRSPEIVEEFQLEGERTSWKHKTMDSETSAQLVDEAHRRLAKKGIVFANEFEFAFFKNMGLSFKETLQLQQDLVKIASSSAAEDCQDERKRLDHYIIHRFPQKIAQDQRIMAYGRPS
jgi:radical SAM superfamily enzyme YgiQ (UPF0313 family)